MENVIILSLIVIMIILWRKNEKLRNDIKKNNKEHDEKVDLLEEKLNDSIENKNEEIRELKNELEESLRKLNFYQNIEEDSGTLNDNINAEEHKQRIEQAVEQLAAERNIQENGNGFDIAAGYLDSEQLVARNKFENQQNNFLVTGKAGTGKSFLLDVFRRTTKKSNVVLAPTGIAALNVKGVTLHSTFGYDNLVKLDIDEISSNSLQLRSEKKQILKAVSTIIIDEISMVRADTFDKIDRILKVVNKNNLPFGGKQIILFGDLFQLPPVAKKDEYNYLLDRYGGIYFFNSDAFKNGCFEFVELSINHRQKNDGKYFELLNRIRVGEVNNSDIALLNSKIIQDESIYDRFTTLLPTKAEVETINRRRIEQLESPLFTYEAEIVKDKYPQKTRNLESIFPIQSTLGLKTGALIMMVANDPEHRWVNGTLGIVYSLSPRSISVAINKRVYEIYMESFVEQDVTYTDGKITYEDVLEVVQYPLVPAYAITIHKSQGQTYGNIICDINRCFTKGQAYVALSRCTSLEGLHIRGEIDRAKIQVDRDVLNFYCSQIEKKN